jgi:chromosome segregation protein
MLALLLEWRSFVRLKKLAILGFKSFADKTVLHFDVGITCIVGPNGCGKSNISDAFRWVLGEQSAKSMRGAKMPDVIFSGTTQRKPLNFAEVSLTLTDVQGTLPIDYEEITITRRLHKSGDSEYLLNGNNVRLKDLQTLFLDSGIGRNAFSIFEQGKLDQVISYTPLERRYIFEEAAGILRFLQRKKEALKRLEQAELNLSRVNDIHLEVEKQIQLLENQAEKARVFKEQKIVLEQLEKANYVLRWQGIEKKLIDLQNKYMLQQKFLDECKQLEGMRLIECQEAKQLNQHHEKALRIQSEKLLTIRSQQEFQMRECQSLEQRLRESQKREKKLKQELEDLAMARQTRQEMFVEIGRKRQQLEADWSEAEAQWIGQQERVKLQKKDVDHLRQQLAIKQQAHLKALQVNSQCQSNLKQTEIRLENLAEQKKQGENRLERLKIEQGLLMQNAEEKKQALKQLSALVDAHKDRLDQYEEELKSFAQEGEKKQKELDATRRKVMEIKARQKVLVRMRDDHEGFSSGSKKLLQEAQNPQSSLYQTLRPFYEFFKSEQESAEAVAVVLRSYAQTLVVELEEDLKRVLAFAEEADLQEYSLICLQWLQSFHGNRLATNASLLQKVSPHPLVRHFLESVTVSSSRDEVISFWIEGKCDEGWCLQGAFIDHRGVLFKVKPNENQVFIRESELKILEDELIVKEEELSQLEQALQHLQHRRTHLQLERAEHDKILRRDEMKLVEVNFGLQRAFADQEKNKIDQTSCEQDLMILKQNFEQQMQAYQTLDQQFSQVKHELVSCLQDKDMLQKELDVQESQLRLQEQEQKEKGTLYQELADNRQQILHQYNLLEIKEQDHEKNVGRIENELGESEERKVQTNLEQKNGLQHLALLETQVNEAAKQYTELEKQTEFLIRQCERADEQLAIQQSQLKRTEHDFSQLQVQLVEQQVGLKAVENELLDRYQLTIEDILQLNLPLKQSLDQIERQIRSLRQSLLDAGDVNLAAIEELEKHQVRNHFLKQQIGDMQQSKGELLEIIQQLDEESHKLFRETFEEIRDNFKKNFQILFEGGEADLHFTDSGEILEAGIEISAKPPGKQMRSITLLSGGEKCLTAVALLFAIFEVKPSPFCVLDEIDAPLDDTNVDRFVNVVKHFAERCQFLIITHNKRTMAIGDILFGISMEEKGVSKLLALEFAHRETPEASLVS